MPATVLTTKLYIPPPRPRIVDRPRLIERLNDGLRPGRKLTLVSAPAGFGKTTLVSEWLFSCDRKAAWLSLDEGDNDFARFLTYLVAALQTVEAKIGGGVLVALQSPQPPPIDSILTALLNEIANVPQDFILVLDDYHVIHTKAIEDALAFLLEHLPPQMHLVIATREDPQLPLARYRARGQLTELRAADLAFTPAESAEFLNLVMGLDLSSEEIAALDSRTEGWVAGLQLAALSMQSHPHTASFIQSFTGSHHFILDYLIEEVLQQQPEGIQTFLLRTSILDRLCGSLCDAVLLNPTATGQEILEKLERTNLFIVPLDNERRWYRYHHLFADLLLQRLYQQQRDGVNEYHLRASQWYEDNGLEVEAFHHAAAAQDIIRVARLIEGHGMPLQFRGALGPVLQWLDAQPAAVLDSRPSLWVMYASACSMAGRLKDVEPKLQSAEMAMQGKEPDADTRNLIGHIAAIRALLAAFQNQVDAIISQSQRALEYLRPDNLAVRTATIWKLGIAYQLQGDRDAAARAYSDAISVSQASGNLVVLMSATSGLGNVQEGQNQLYAAAENYHRILQLAGDAHQWAACEAHLGLARIFYEWNELDTAEQHAQQGIRLAKQVTNNERSVALDVVLSRVKLARGDLASAAELLGQTSQLMRQDNFMDQSPVVAAAQVITYLQQGDLASAADLAQSHALPISQARVHLAQGHPSQALAVLVPYIEEMEGRGWQDEIIKAMALQAVILNALSEADGAIQVLGAALAMGQPGGFIRTFVDEGEPMRLLIADFRLLIEKQPGDRSHHLIDYSERLLAAFPLPSIVQQSAISNHQSTNIEPLSKRELEVLRLIAQGLSNREISERLFLSLNTVKGHSRIIFDKLQVKRRTEAVARARELGLM
ncbi:MAG TPA: LuxR C-terminal-related transcriptional regulator [Anaerolineaceae bacterium]|nr:LuxR C-terminal-related transcriptional regulator [Anaerolineaceae bacterium]